MLSVLSLFSGAGGLDIGFERTGFFQTFACIDADVDCIETLCQNQSLGASSGVHSHLAGAQIQHADLSFPEDALGLTRIKQVDVIIGGPPCQSFSVLGKRRGMLDARGSLIYSYLKAIELLRPRAFVLENVPGFASIDGGEVLESVHRLAKELGYVCWSGRLCAANYGDATVRTRFFLLGFLHPKIPLGAPPFTHGESKLANASQQCFDLLNGSEEIGSLKPFTTVSDALSGLSEPNESNNLNAHVEVRHRAETIERFKLLQPGERDVARRRNRLRPDAPALTLFAGGVKGKKQARTHIHPYAPRELTPRECARLHSFPDYWVFAGESDSVLTQVANSVPIEMASAIGRLVARTCEGGSQ